jgi:hypothetical protein
MTGCLKALLFLALIPFALYGLFVVAVWTFGVLVVLAS